MDDTKEFESQVQQNIKGLAADTQLEELSLSWMAQAAEHNYTYNFSWLGLPIIQLPQDIVALQELIWLIKPELIIETGVARGGSLVFYASMLELLGGDGQVLGIDIDIREHNRKRIEAHPMAKRISMLEGSSVDPGVIGQVAEIAAERTRVLVVLDSNHTHEHVLNELRAYSQFVTPGSYLVVLDTVVNDLPDHFNNDRPWSCSDNPKTAVAEFMKNNSRFVVDDKISSKLLVSVAPGGYLRCVEGPAND